MDFDAVAYLATKGLRGKPASGGREMTYPCFFECGEPADGRKRKLYLHVADGFYHCKVCGASGGSYTLQKHFGDDPRQGSTDDAFMRRRILDHAVERGVQMAGNNEDVLLYLLTERGLNERTILERRLGFVGGGWSLLDGLSPDVTREQIKSTGLVHREGPREGKDFLYRHLLIPYLSRGHCIQLRGRAWGESKGGRYFTGPGEPPRLYNADSLDGADEAIVCEGEFDAMILAQALAECPDPRARNIAVVAIPGTGSIPEEFDDVLSDLKRVYLGLDSDPAGQKAAETLKERLGSRARILSLPYVDGRKCDWTEYLLPEAGPGSDWRARHPYAGHNGKDVLRLLSQASGRRVFTIAEAGAAFRAYRGQNTGLKTGFAQLDATILPGLLPGQVVVILAKTGAGKTLWLCNLAYNMRAHKILFASLEMTQEEIYERMIRIYLFHNPRASEDEAEAGLANIMIADQNRLSEKDLSSLVDEYRVELDAGPEVVIVDYLGYFARGVSGNSPYEKAGNAVMALKAFAKDHRLVVVSPSQVNRGAKPGKPIDLDDARDAGQIEETADFLLALFRPDEAVNADMVLNAQPSGKVRCSVLKSRHGGVGRVFGFQMDLMSLAIVDDVSPEAKRADHHNYLLWRGHTWEDMRRSETAPRQMSFQENP